jgi:hypothetical protein
MPNVYPLPSNGSSQSPLLFGTIVGEHGSQINQGTNHEEHSLTIKHGLSIAVIEMKKQIGNKFWCKNA